MPDRTAEEKTIASLQQRLRTAYSDGYADGYARGQAGDEPFVEPSCIEDLHEVDQAAKRVRQWIETYRANNPHAEIFRLPISYESAPILLQDLEALVSVRAKA